MNPSAIPNPNQHPDQTPAWMRALPTIGGTVGGILGGIGGGATGVAAGAAIPGADLTGVPEVAGGIGGFKLGSTGGAAAGGAAGQTAEDLLTGKLNLGTVGRAGMAGIENGVGSLLGGGLIKGGGALLKGASGLLEKGAAGRTAQAAQAVENVPWQGIAGSAAAKNANLEGTLSRMKDYGIGTNPDDLKAVIPQITGKDGAVLSDLVRGGMAKSTSPVDISGSVSLANNIAGSPELATEGPTVGKAFVNTVNKVLGLGENGTTTKNAAADIYQARQLLMDKAYSKGTSDALSSAYHDVAQSLDGALTKSGVDGIVNETGITPAQFKALHDISPQLANEASTASQQGVGALRSLQKPFVDASNLVQAQKYNAGGQLPGAIENKTAQVTPSNGIGLTDALAVGGALPTHGLSLLGLLPHAAQIGSMPKVQDAALSGIKGITDSAASKIVPTITRAGAIAAANLPNEVPQGGANPSAIPAATGAPASGMGAGGGTLNQVMQQEIQDQNALMNRSLLTPANFGGDSLAGSAAGLGGVVAGLAPQVQKQELAGQALSGLLPSFENAGGAQGTLGGLMSQATAAIPGSAANTYQRQQATAAAALASLLGISPQEAAGLLPRLTQDQNAAGNSEQVLRGISGNVNPGSGSVLNSLAIPQLQLSSGR